MAVKCLAIGFRIITVIIIITQASGMAGIMEDLPEGSKNRA